jgi:Domain of unknown function (DUF4292)
MNRRPWPLFLAVLAGCPAHLDVRNVQAPDATALLAEVDAVDSRVTGIQSQAKAHVEGPGGKGNVTAFVAAAAPSSVHLEVLDFFGRPSGILVSDGARFALFRSEPGVWLQGPATAENVGRLIPVELPPEQLVSMLLGRAPRLADAHPELAVDAEANAFRITLREGQRSQELWVDPQRKRVVRSRLSGPGGYELAFDEFEDVRDVPFPRKLSFTGSASVVLRYTDPRLNDTPAPSLFNATPPPGAPVEQVGALRPPARAHTAP